MNNEEKLIRLIINRENVYSKAKLSLFKLDTRINKIILIEEYNSTTEKVRNMKENINELKNSPSIAKWGEGGHLAELDRQLNITTKIKELKEKIKEEREKRKQLKEIQKENKT